jgi:transposase
MKQTSVCVVDGEGNRVWQGKCASISDEMEEVIRKRVPCAVRIALEAGPLTVWHWHALRSANLPVLCVHARDAKLR